MTAHLISFRCHAEPINCSEDSVSRRIELRRLTMTLTLAAVGMMLSPLAGDAQDWTRREFPLAPPNSTGNFVAPYFDGFYPNADGTYTLSFGFMNRNDEELIEIELGPNNFIEPAEYNGGQPTSFPTVRYSGFGGPRERGVFGVIVPADFEGRRLVDDHHRWLHDQGTGPSRVTRDRSSRQPTSSVRAPWPLGRCAPPSIGRKAMRATGASRARGNPRSSPRPSVSRSTSASGPGIAVSATWAQSTSPCGSTRDLSAARSRSRSMVEALPDARPPRRGGRTPGPGPLMTRQTVNLPLEGPHAHHGRFTATFDTPGEYVIRVKVDSFGLIDSAPGHQCCWTNGYVRVSVSDQ